MLLSFRKKGIHRLRWIPHGSGHHGRRVLHMGQGGLRDARLQQRSLAAGGSESFRSRLRRFNAPPQSRGAGEQGSKKGIKGHRSDRETYAEIGTAGGGEELRKLKAISEPMVLSQVKRELHSNRLACPSLSLAGMLCLLPLLCPLSLFLVWVCRLLYLAAMSLPFGSLTCDTWPHMGPDTWPDTWRNPRLSKGWAVSAAPCDAVRPHRRSLSPRSTGRGDMKSSSK